MHGQDVKHIGPIEPLPQQVQQQVDELPSKNQALAVCILCNLYCFGACVLFYFVLLCCILCVIINKLNHC